MQKKIGISNLKPRNWENSLTDQPIATKFFINRKSYKRHLWQNNFFWTEFALGFGATKDRVDPIGSDNRSAKQILMPITRKPIPELYHLKIVDLRRRSESSEARLHMNRKRSQQTYTSTSTKKLDLGRSVSKQRSCPEIMVIESEFGTTFSIRSLSNMSNFMFSFRIQAGFSTQPHLPFI